MSAAPLRRARVLIARAVSEFFDDRCALIAAAIAYYGLLSLFPLAILLVGGYSALTGGAQARGAVIDFLLDNLPLREGAGRRDLRQLLETVAGNAAAFGVVGVAGLVFAASGLMGAVRNGINAAFDSEVRRAPVQGKLIDLLLVLAVGFVVGVSLALTLAARIVELPIAFGADRLVPVVVSFAVFVFLYSLVPPARPRLRDVWPGALLATVGYEAAKEGFSLYLDSFGRYGAVYGSLGAVMAFLVFAFVGANVFLLGAEAASEWPGVRDADVAELESGPPASRRLRTALRGLVSRDPPTSAP